MSVILAYRSISTDALCVITGVPPIFITLCHGMGKYSIFRGHGNGSVIIDGVVIHKDVVTQKLHTFDFPSNYCITPLSQLQHAMNVVPATR